MNRTHIKRTCYRVLHCMKRILVQFMDLIFDYPNTVTGIILSLIIGLMLFMIPLIGPWLFIIAEPFLLICFVVMFGSKDYKRI